MSEVTQSTGWCKLYHPSGALVTIPVNCVPIDYKQMIANVTSMIDAGFLVNAPGLDEGEQKETIGFVVRREKEGENGQQTPIVDLYPAGGDAKWSMLSVYLNHRSDVEAFEYASNMKLESIPLYIGANKIERGKSKQTDNLVKQAPKPFGVVFKLNPKHDPNTEDGRMKPKRLFVRWELQKPSGEAKTEAKQQEQQPPQTDAQVREWVMGEAKAIGLKPETVVVEQAIDDWKDYSDAILANMQGQGINAAFKDRVLSYCRYQWWLMHLASAGPNPTTVQSLVKDLVEDKILGGAAKSSLISKFNEAITSNSPW